MSAKAKKTHRVLKGFAFGEFNSRGGSFFLVGNNIKKIKKYLYEDLFDMGEYDSKEAEKLFNDTFICKAKLYIPLELDIDIIDGNDLEWDENGVVLSSKGKNIKPLEWYNGNDIESSDGILMHDPDGDLTSEYEAGRSGEIVDLEFVPNGKQPVILKSWHHPPWEEDANGFSLCIV